MSHHTIARRGAIAVAAAAFAITTAACGTEVAEPASSIIPLYGSDGVKVPMYGSDGTTSAVTKPAAKPYVHKGRPGIE